MNPQKIAILTDSCCDVPKDLAKQYGIYVLPVNIVFKDHTYKDGVDIEPQEVYERMKIEIPTSSLPDGAAFLQVFDEIKQAGYEHVLAITLSGGLSGTNNMMRLMAESYEGLDFFILDTKNIAIAAGFHAIQAARYIEQGLSFEEIQKRLIQDIPHSKVFFVVETLEYLQKGGRIGLVASLLGNVMKLKPVISCNEEGIYYTVAKVRGRRQSIRKTIDLALDYAKGHKKINLAVCHGGAFDVVQEVEEIVKEALPEHEVFIHGQISPVLGVHTGPGLIGVGVEYFDEEE